MKCKSIFVAVALFLSAVARPSAAQVGAGVPEFQVRKGYKVTLAAQNFGQARHIELDDKGNLYVSQPKTGMIACLSDKDGDGVYETKANFLTGYRDTDAMCWDNGWLYCTSTVDGSCKRARSTKGDGVADEVETVFPAGTLPPRGGHPFIGICLTKDYIFCTTSDPQNMTDELPSDRKCVWRFDRDGKNRMQFATGIRNTEKIRLRPGTDEVWGLDHGTDNFGGTYGETKGNQPITDLLPGEELNMIVEGGFYGHPYISNNRIVRPEFAKRPDIVELANKTIPPAWVFGGHWAPNGFTFLTKDTLTGQKGDMIATFHGSWNSVKKVGYRIDRVLFETETGKPYGDLQLISTLSADGNNVLERPVDAVEAADGSVLWSGDLGNRVYRLTKSE